MKKIIKAFLCLILSCTGISLYAQNPIVPPGVYIADPSAHQWKDGKMYVYGSKDTSLNEYCSYSYDVLSSSDLKKWTLTPRTFAAKGAGDAVPYSDGLLYAPDCAYFNGLYYLYYCMSDIAHTEGVATAKSPLGPFLNGRDINVGKNNQIDPCVFVDDDGKAYYIWGQFHAKVALLKPDGLSIDSSTIKDNVVTQEEHFFHEGGYMIKRNGIYYFIYAHMGRAGRPTCLGYAMSKSPFGPFKYGGVIIDNDHCDPEVWNNHGSLVEFNKQWYVFYHRSTNGVNSMRKACVEPVYFNKDGTIPEVEMTTQGASKPLNARNELDAARACLLYGNVRVQRIADDKEALCKIRNTDMAVYKYLDFGKGADSISVNVAPGANPAKITVRLDDSWGPDVGVIEVPGNGDGKTWKVFTAKVNHSTGVHALWLSFKGKGDELMKVDWLKFTNNTAN